jgi:hypothetical protein
MMPGQTNTYIVKFVLGQSDAVDRIEANLIRDGGSLSVCDAALLHIKPFFETPRCCKKIGAKVARYREQYEVEKSTKLMVELKLEHSQQEVERVMLSVSPSPLVHTYDLLYIRLFACSRIDMWQRRVLIDQNLQLERTSAAVQAELDLAKAAIDSRDEQVEKLKADVRHTPLVDSSTTY